MAAISLSVAELFKEAFGYHSPAFNFEQLPQRQEATSRGTPYWAKSSATGRDYYMPVKLAGYMLPHPVISVRARKNIIDTPLTERAGSVKELISIDDYSIQIRGIIIEPDQRNFPEKVVGELATLFEVNSALEIISPITELLLPISSDGAQKVVITEFDFPEMRSSSPGVRAYALNCVSDIDFNLLQIL